MDTIKRIGRYSVPFDVFLQNDVHGATCHPRTGGGRAHARA
jgi:hypothetical protein